MPWSAAPNQWRPAIGAAATGCRRPPTLLARGSRRRQANRQGAGRAPGGVEIAPANRRATPPSLRQDGGRRDVDESGGRIGVLRYEVVQQRLHVAAAVVD